MIVKVLHQVIEPGVTAMTVRVLLVEIDLGVLPIYAKHGLHAIGLGAMTTTAKV
ncbi:hypothetical protein LEP1GSC017_1901 [Leptospira meyeri serovar Hardjo str. Went 5]|nr:hypothetical protein LEP1GSC017_1901 [Leptospira meyeri serovar Hardjo str. Went 5]